MENLNINSSSHSSDDLISIAIPSFKKPDYLKKAIQSVLDQTYRPIEIIVSEDGNSKECEKIVKDYISQSRENIDIKFFFQEKNLGPQPNMQFLYKKSRGKYFMWLPHDDWFIDNNFLLEGITEMKKNECSFVFGNSLLESTNKIWFQKKMPDNWTIMNSEDYVIENMMINMCPVYSAIIMDKTLLDEMNFSRFFISKETSASLKIEPDEAYVMLGLLAAKGSVAITGKAVSVRGQPRDNYSGSKYWRKRWRSAVSIPHLQAHYFLKSKNKKLSDYFLKSAIFTFGFRPINLKIVDFFKSEKKSYLYILIGTLIAWMKIFKIITIFFIKEIFLLFKGKQKLDLFKRKLNELWY